MAKVLFIDPAIPDCKDESINLLDSQIASIRNIVDKELYDRYKRDHHLAKGIKTTYKDYPNVANLGLVMLATVSKNDGHETRYFQFSNKAEDMRELEDLISGSDVVGLSTMSTTVDFALELARFAKRIKSQVQVVLGGSEVTSSRNEYIKDEAIDAIFRGESEDVFLRFLEDPRNYNNLRQLKGVSFKHDGQIIADKHINIVDVQKLPTPLWDIIPDLASTQIYMELSRGCRYSCKFCMEHNDNVRYKTEEQMVKEFEKVESLRSNSLMHIMDSDFAVSKKFLERFVRAVQKTKTSNYFNVQTRIDGINKQKLDMMYSNHVDIINFGLDNLSDIVLEKVNKKLDLNKIKKGLQIARENSPTRLSYRGNFIQGLPGETSVEAGMNLQRRKELLESGLLSVYRDYIFMPVPGSIIYNEPAQFELQFSTKTSTFRNSIPSYSYIGSNKISGLEIYLHHLSMRQVINDHYQKEFKMDDMIKSLLDEVDYKQRNKIMSVKK